LVLIEKFADRMLSLVAPKITAGACACNGPVTLSCFSGFCKDGHHYAKVCNVTCNCSIISCGPCFVINNCG
jgi:hypothetical protein